MIFDRDDTKPRDEKIFRRPETDDLPAGFDRSGRKMRDPAPVGTGWVNSV